MGEVISLVDRLREKNEKIEYEQGKYPIFEGKIMSVSGELIHDGETSTIIDYLPTGTEFPEPNFSMEFNNRAKEEYEAQAKKAFRRILVPFSVNPEIVNGANVKGHIKVIEEHRVYSLEVLKDESLSESARMLGAFAGHQLGSKYAGFQYLVPLIG